MRGAEPPTHPPLQRLLPGWLTAKNLGVGWSFSDSINEVLLNLAVSFNQDAWGKRLDQFGSRFATVNRRILNRLTSCPRVVGWCVLRSLNSTMRMREVKELIRQKLQVNPGAARVRDSNPPLEWVRDVNGLPGSWTYFGRLICQVTNAVFLFGWISTEWLDVNPSSSIGELHEIWWSTSSSLHTSWLVEPSGKPSFRESMFYPLLPTGN